MTRTIELTGSVQAAGEAAIVARASGYLDTLTVDLGDRIRAGMPIGTLVAPEVLNRVLIAKAELARREMAIAQANQLKTLAETRLAETDAYINVAKSQVIARRTELGIKKTIASMARVTLERTRLMTLEGAATQQSLDEAELALTNAESEILIADSEVASKSAHLSAAEAKKGVAAADVSAALSHISVRRAEADKAKAELNGALQEERWLTIQSPISGTVTARHVHPGIFVRDALQSNPTVLVQIQADGPVRIRFEVPSSDADLVKKGMTAQVRARGHDLERAPPPLARSCANSTSKMHVSCQECLFPSLLRSNIARMHWSFRWRRFPSARQEQPFLSSKMRRCKKSLWNSACAARTS